jgi:basic membrane lipoprotein Med (substrate-binding protein (PBP1-ABC) superfamily)
MQSHNTVPGSGQVRVGLVTDVGGKIDDGTFSQYGYEGMRRAAEEFGLETTYIETARPGDIEGNILMLVEGGYQLIITVGQKLGEVTERMAKDYPGTNFAGWIPGGRAGRLYDPKRRVGRSRWRPNPARH